MYKIKHIKNITRLGILNIGDEYNREINNKIDLSSYFWNRTLSKEFLTDFLLNKYLKEKSYVLEKDKYLKIEKDINFILDKLDFVKAKINFVDNDKLPGGDDIFFSYRLFSSILNFINDYFSQEKIALGLIDGVIFENLIKSLEDLVYNIEFYKKTEFIKSLVEPILDEIFNKKQNYIYVFEIFWPSELILVGIIGTYIKKFNKNSKIIVDLSVGNEQFDFSQWANLIVNSSSDLFKYYDYFIIDRDFGVAISQVADYLNGKIEKKEVKNVIFYEKKVYFNKISDFNSDQDIFEQFIKSTFEQKEFGKIFKENAISARFLPYKCYWGKCSFCTINSQNNFCYNEKYSYSLFIDKWIKYIKDNKVKAINFEDEAIPPKLIIKFASKLVQKGLRVNYKFRTRFDKLYTYNNCKILAESGCSYCGMGLESAVTRVNEQIANKGNFGITIFDKTKIIHNFDKANIAFHSYSIMGFPGETEKESAITYKFLKDNILKSNFFTCTPNLFGLMKGSKIFLEREKYGVEIEQEDLDNPFNLIYEFRYKSKVRNIVLLRKFEEDLHRVQFLPWLDNFTNITGKDFWFYLDRTYMFYLVKRYYKTNPFYSYKNINNEILEKSFNEILKEKLTISNYFQIYEYKNNDITLYNWIGDNKIIFDKKYKSFINNYNDKKDLSENIKKSKVDLNKEFIKLIELLLKERILIRKH